MARAPHHAGKLSVATCTQCEHQRLVPHSCGHRHCPHCQHHESQQRIDRQLAQLVPDEYFLITFTLPERHPQQWVVGRKCVGAGKPALIYLGRYFYRGVIREQNILAYDHDSVSFRYRDAKTGQSQTRTVTGALS